MVDRSRCLRSEDTYLGPRNVDPAGCDSYRSYAWIVVLLNFQTDKNADHRSVTPFLDVRRKATLLSSKGPCILASVGLVCLAP